MKQVCCTPSPVVENSMKGEGEKLSQQRIGHTPTREIERVRWIPGAVRSSGGGRRIGHLTCAMVPKSRGRNWNFGLQKRIAPNNVACFATFVCRKILILSVFSSSHPHILANGACYVTILKSYISYFLQI